MNDADHNGLESTRMDRKNH